MCIRDRHYSALGFSEGRALAFDATVYKSLNADLASLSDADALTHFNAFGRSEGRKFNFDATEYKAANTDLASLSDADALAHFVAFGAAENRLVEFNAASYRAANSDLASLSDADALTHYIALGRSEGRLLSFDADDYLSLNTDLSAAGITTATALDHYNAFGRNENRPFIDPVAVADSGDFTAAGPVTYTLSVDDSTLVDEGSSLTFTITPSGTVTEATELFLQLTGSTVGAITSGTDAADFSSVLSSVSFAVGDSTAKTVAITVTEDSTAEGAEAYQAQLLDSTFTAVSGTALTGTVNDNVNAPQSLSLTTSADNLSGAGGNDTFSASAATAATQQFQSADTLDGGAGTDTFNLTIANAATFIASNVSNIENVISQFTAAGTLSLSGSSGITALTANASTAAGVFTAIPSIIPITVANKGQNTTFDFANSALSGSADTVTATVSNFSANTLTIASVSGTEGAETIALVSTGGANTLTLDDDTATDLTTLTITGDQDLTLTTTPTTITSLDAQGLAATLTHAATNTAAATVTGGSGNDAITASNAGAVNDSISGGAGNDTITFAGNLATTDTVDGGDGTDTLGLTTALATAYTAPSTATITNFETLSVSDALAGGLTAANIQAGLTRVDLAAGTGAQTVTLEAGTQAITIGAANTGILTVSDTGSATTDVLTITNDATTAVDVLAGFNLIVGGFETVTFDGSGGGTAQQDVAAITPSLLPI